MDHSMHTLLNESEVNEDNVMGSTVYGAEDARIGVISHVHGQGSHMQVIVDVGGFLGIGAKPVSIGRDALTFMRDEDGAIHATTAWTRDQVMDLPPHRH